MTTEKQQATELNAQVGELKAFQMPTTGDSLAKDERITVPKDQHLGGYAGTSIISQMPKAEIVEGRATPKVKRQDYDKAMQEVILTMAKHFLLTTPDVFAHAKIRAAVATIESYDDDEATINQMTATGGGVPVSQTSTGTVDADPIPASSTTTTDATVQPADKLTPADPVEAETNHD